MSISSTDAAKAALKICYLLSTHHTPVLLPGKSYGQRSLEGCSPWGRWGLDTTEWFHFHFSLSCIGEGNSNSLQCSCLENPRDSGAWWAAIYGVAQSRTRPKWLSSSSSMYHLLSLKEFYKPYAFLELEWYSRKDKLRHLFMCILLHVQVNKIDFNSPEWYTFFSL